MHVCNNNDTQQFWKVKVVIIGNHHIDLLYFLFIFNIFNNQWISLRERIG